jgi:two-component system sensor histidine kinase KdpD
MRLESPSVELRRDWQTLDDLIGMALARVQGRQGEHRFVVDLPADLPSIHVDGALLQQLFVNLLDNALKYTPPDTELRISARVAGDQLLVVVEDDGPGLPGDDPERLFDKFRRGDSEGAVVGVGLGLAICRAIARVHGGEITARRGVRGGARFEVQLPLVETDG